MRQKRYAVETHGLATSSRSRLRTAPRYPRFGVLVAAAGIALVGCGDANRGAETIPSQSFFEPQAEYALVVDSARVLARSHMARGDLAGVSVAVGRDGELVWAEGFGWANVSTEELADPNTQYRIGSISKPLTSTAAALLVERGALDLDLPIRTYIPEYPEKRWDFSTRQALGHIAGIREYGMLDALRTESCVTGQDKVAQVAEDSLEFEPGTDYQYANQGYNLVAAVIEAVAEEPFLDFIDREVLVPLGLEHTSGDFGGETLQNMAVPYDYGSFRTLRQSQDMDMSCHVSAGGFVSTPSDLVTFAHSMLNADLLEEETIQELWTPLQLADGEPTEYALGWSVGSTRLGDDQRGTASIGHGGRVTGGRASLIILPETGTVVAVTTNMTSGNADRLARGVAALFRPSGVHALNQPTGS